MSVLDYKPFVDPANVPRIPKAGAHMDLFNYPPVMERLLGMWGPLSQEPFRGVTEGDGKVRSGLFSLSPHGAPVTQAAEAAGKWLASLSGEQRARVNLPVDSELWRHWQNTPLILREELELEELDANQRELALAVLKASLSQEGWARTDKVMANNEFLGKINDLADLMNRWSFALCIFGQPSTTEPWGWQFFGHHLALNCFFVGEQMVLSPVFMGMEPDIADETRRRTFEPHEQAGLAFMRSLSETEREQAVLWDSMIAADHPPGRFHPDDGRQLGGAFQDNRVVPVEGLPVSALDSRQRRLLMEIAELFISNLPGKPAEATLKDIERHLGDSHFAWVGKVDDVNPFYFRIFNPVAMIEFDHHSGIFLANKDPARFHVHTIVRTPNGNDYGADLLRQHYALGGHDRGATGAQGGGGGHGHHHHHDHSADSAHANVHSHDGGRTFHRHD